MAEQQGWLDGSIKNKSASFYSNPAGFSMLMHRNNIRFCEAIKPTTGGRRQRRQPSDPPAPLRGTSVLDSDQDRFYQIPEPPPLPPAPPWLYPRIAYLAIFCRSFFNQNFQSNFHPILMRFCLQLGLQNPPKIHPKSISRVSWKFDAILVRFFPFFLGFPSLGDTQNLAKTL